MKTLKFMSPLVPQMLSGAKTLTWRLFDDKDLQTGDEFVMLNKATGKEFAKGKIIKVEEKKFRELEDNDFEGHEKYKDQKNMLAHYKSYYGDKVNLDTTVKMINFELI